ncbi:MAG: hypothetical protein SGBAC_007406, partial [Bacillariaceae sp.]
MTRASRFVVNDDDDDDDDDDQVMEGADSPSEGLASAASASASRTTKSQTPQVIILDSNWDMTISKLAYMVRSTLLREPSSSSSTTKNDNDDDNDDSTLFHVTEETLESEVEDCLRRIHLATVDEVQDAWVPTLECLRYKLKDITNHPTLLLWDGFFTDSTQPE